MRMTHSEHTSRFRHVHCIWVLLQLVLQRRCGRREIGGRGFGDLRGLKSAVRADDVGGLAHLGHTCDGL